MDKYYNPFIADSINQVHKAVESANKNLNNALEIAISALHEVNAIMEDARYGETNHFILDNGDARNINDIIKEALDNIAKILKIKEK